MGESRAAFSDSQILITIKRLGRAAGGILIQENGEKRGQGILVVHIPPSQNGCVMLLVHINSFTLWNTAAIKLFTRPYFWDDYRDDILLS